jgi:hypothetical protein
MTMKKFLIDGAVLCGVALAAFVFAQKPVLDWRPVPTAGSKPVKEEKVVAQDRKEVAKDVAPFPDQDVSLAFLKKRNIFSLDGSYTAVKAATMQAQVIPENPYTLLAILQGKERNALFREFTGAVITAPLRKKMIDGFVVTRIGDLNVSLKRGKETKEMGVFTQMASAAAKTKASAAKEKTASDNPYILLGVLQGKGKARAILQDRTRGVITAQAGQIMEDDFILSRIDPISVQFKRGKEVKELKLYDPREYTKPPPEKPQKQTSGSADTKKTGTTSGSDMIKKPAKAKPGVSK